jgi:hypothetical protein
MARQEALVEEGLDGAIAEQRPGEFGFTVMVPTSAGTLPMRRARVSSALFAAVAKARRSSRSRGWQPVSANSGKTTRSQSCLTASW